MKKNLIIAMAFILISATLFPPSYTAFSEETGKYCESMSFNIQTVRAGDELIEGQAETDQEIELEIDVYKETVIANDNDQFRFEIDKDMLEIGDRIKLVNAQHEIEMEVKESDAQIEIIQSELVGECEVPQEMTEEYEDTKASEQEEDDNLAEEATEEEKAEETLENDASEESEEATDEESTEEIREDETLEDSSEEEVREENPEETTNETSSEEASEDESSEQSSEEESEEVESETETTEEPSSEEASEDESSEQSSEEASSTIIGTFQTPGLIDVDLLSDSTLDVTHRETSNGKQEITLTYRGYGALQLGLLNNTYSNFYIPPEIMNEITEENLTATYDVPLLGILGIVLRNEGTFEQEQINTDGNHIYMDFFNLLSLNLLSDSYFTFTLTIELDELPPTQDGEYVFHSVTTDQLIDLSLISSDIASATLPAPGMIAFHNVPTNISFETTSISPNSGKVRIPRQNPDWTLQVRDTRGENSEYRIMAEQQKPLTSSDESHTLPDGLVYVDEDLESHPLSKGPIEVYSGTTEEQPVSSINWDENHGPMIEVDPVTVKEDTYDATIRWTIVNGP